MDPVHHLSRNWEREGVVQEGPMESHLVQSNRYPWHPWKTNKTLKMLHQQNHPSLDWRGKKNERKERAAQSVEVCGHCWGNKRRAISAEDSSGADRTSLGPEAGADGTLICPEVGTSVGPERRTSLIIIFRSWNLMKIVQLGFNLALNERWLHAYHFLSFAVGMSILCLSHNCGLDGCILFSSFPGF